MSIEPAIHYDDNLFALIHQMERPLQASDQQISALRHQLAEHQERLNAQFTLIEQLRKKRT